MSLVNQVLKDLEQRHASQAQAEELGIDDLRYVPTTQAPPKRSFKWAILASVLVALGVLTVAGTYLFNKWGTPHSSTQIATPASAMPLQSQANVEQKKDEAADVQVAVVPSVAEQSVKQKQEQVPAKLEAATQIASVSKPPSGAKKTRSVMDEEPQGTMQKNIVPLKNEQRAEFAYKEGVNHITARHYRKAEMSLRNALALEPVHIKAREMLAGVYISQGRWVEASELLRNGLAVSPHNPSFTKLYARSLMQLKRDKQAIEVLSASHPPVAQDPEHYAILAALYQRQSRHNEATRAYSEILKVHPHMAIWWVGMGISLEALGEREQAVAAYQQARKSGSLNGDVARYTDNRLLALDAINYPIN